MNTYAPRNPNCSGRMGMSDRPANGWLSATTRISSGWNVRAQPRQNTIMARTTGPKERTRSCHSSSLFSNRARVLTEEGPYSDSDLYR